MNNFCGERSRRRLLDFGVFPTFQYPISNYTTSSQTKTEMKTTFEENFFANNLHLIQDPLRKNLANTVITNEDKKTMGKTKVMTKEPEMPQRDYHPFHSGFTGVLTGILNFMGLSHRSTRQESDYKDHQVASDHWHIKNQVQNHEIDCDNICRSSAHDNNTNLFSEFQPSVAKESFIEQPEYEIGLFNENCIEYYCPNTYHNQEICETASQAVKTELNICVDLDNTQKYVKNTENTQKNSKTELNGHLDVENVTDNVDVTIKTKEVALSCEDKLSKLKALLKCNQKNKESNTKPVDIPSKEEIINDTSFANEIASSDLTNSFNEVSGKFLSSSISSEDSFQIVFTDSPQTFERRRISSDCDSEDSFIVFEETTDCYTNNDIFGDDDSSDSDSVADVPITQLSPNLSRTVSDLTDTSLYSEDVVDFAVKCDLEVDQKCNGLLLDEQRKREKRQQPTKRVRFSSQPPKVHVMRVWAFAARQARAGHWERHALDRERFKRRIADVEMAISWVLKPQHRTRVVFQRFMPWWNAEKRRELAEKKNIVDDDDDEIDANMSDENDEVKEIAQKKENRMKDQKILDDDEIDANMSDEKYLEELTKKEEGNRKNEHKIVGDDEDDEINTRNGDEMKNNTDDEENCVKDQTYAKISVETNCLENMTILDTWPYNNYMK